MASNLYNTASVLVPKGAAGRASVIDAYRPAFNVLQSIGITRNDANGSFRNQQGLIEFAAANVPRFNWDEGDSCPKLLVEPSRENFVSDNTSPASWYNAVLTPTNEGAFELNSSADWGKYTQSGTVNNLGFLYAGFTAGEDYAISTYVKISESGDYIGLRETGNGLGVIQISTATITTAGAGLTDVKVFDTSNADIKRVVLIGQAGGTSNNFFFQLPSSTGNSGVDDGNTLQITAFQVEKGTYETSVIFTSGTTQTRNADVISQTGLASLIGDSEGTLYFEAEAFDVSGATAISLNDASTSDRVFISYASGSMFTELTKAGVQEAAVFAGSLSNNTIYKTAVAYAVNDFVTYLDGTNIGSDTTLNTFADGTLTDIRFNSGGGGSPFYGKISVLAWWQARLENDVLESLTSYETYEEMAATLDYTID